MLINLSHHPFNKWFKNQKEEAENCYGSVVDLEFPHIPAENDLKYIDTKANNYLIKIKSIFKEQSSKNNAVHVMGEFTFTFNLLEKLKKNNIQAIASTTVRNVNEDEKGNKITKFNFVQFRKYY